MRPLKKIYAVVDVKYQLIEDLTNHYWMKPMSKWRMKGFLNETEVGRSIALIEKKHFRGLNPI